MTFYGSSSRKEKQQVATALVPWERRGDFKPEFTLFVAFDEGRPVGLNIVGDPQNIISYLRDIQSYIVTEVIPKFEPHPS
jgi:hypothetical protein